MAAIWRVITALLSIKPMIEWVWAGVMRFYDYYQQKKRDAEQDAAIAKAKKEKDTSDFENSLNR